MLNFFSYIGSLAINFITEAGGILILFFRSIAALVTGKLRIHSTFQHMYYIGVRSSGVVILTSTFIGMVEALQIYHGFHKFGAENMIGYTVAVSLGRELAPVITALMVVARSVSAMAAEIGSMKVTEQIDALRVMAVDPINFLVSPRIIATTIMMPFLVIISNVAGNIGGYLVGIIILKLNPTSYISNIQTFISSDDITYGFIKAAVFGLIISLIGCYMGMNTKGGSRGVGVSTTNAVVLASVSVFVADYFLSAFMY